MLALKKVYILLTHSGSVPSLIIKACTRKPFTHVALSLDPSLTVLYSFCRKRPHNPWVGGFSTEGIHGQVSMMFQATTYGLYEVSVSDQQFEQLIQNLARFELEGDKYSYNFLGVAGAALGVPVVRKRHYFCSQFVARLLADSGIQVVAKPWALVTPEDFRKSQQLNLVGQGLLRELRTEIKNSVQDHS